jgi:DNA-binding NtrC family response regulator
MGTFSKNYERHPERICRLDEVKRRAIVDALDQCRGHYLTAARLLGIGRTTIYRMARKYNYQPSKVQAERLMTISQYDSPPDPA